MPYRSEIRGYGPVFEISRLLRNSRGFKCRNAWQNKIPLILTFTPGKDLKLTNYSVKRPQKTGKEMVAGGVKKRKQEAVTFIFLTFLRKTMSIC